MRRFSRGVPARDSDSVLPEVDRRFRRFALWAALVALTMLVIVGIVFSIRARRSLHGQVERMELAVSRGLAAILSTPSAGDLAVPIDALDSTATRWRDRLRNWKSIPRIEAEKILTLQTLQDKTIPGWRAELASEDSARLRREIVLRDVLREQSSWPPPPPPPIVWEFSTGVKEFSSGALEGAIWPWLVGSRAAQLWNSPSRVRFPVGARFILFPHRSAGLSFGAIFGFAVFVVASGYFLCHAGMKTNAALFSVLGLLYFLYAIIYAMFIGFLLTHLID